MGRDVTDADGTAWTCLQAYAGLGDRPPPTGDPDGGEVAVVCTPSGGARSVRLTLPADWESRLDDSALLAGIANG